MLDATIQSNAKKQKIKIERRTCEHETKSLHLHDARSLATKLRVRVQDH